MPRAVSWIENNFFIPETRNDPHLRGRIGLQPYQRDILNEALTPDENGKYKYSIIVWSDIKKSAKSSIAAAVNLYRATYTEFGECYVIANDLKQADSRVAHYIRRAIELNPKMRKRYKQQGYRIVAPSGFYIEAIPIDPSGEAGTNADMITFCLDTKTEVLTRSGWKGWKTLTILDEIATRSPEGIFEWQLPVGIHCAPYTGKMIGLTNRSIDMLVTPEHRVYGKFIGGRGIAPGINGNYKHEFLDTLENRFLEAKEVIKTSAYYPVTTSEWPDGEADSFEIPATYRIAGYYSHTRRKILNQKSKTISPELYAEFMGWFLSEGCAIRNGGVPEGFTIAQSLKINPEKRARILLVLKEMGFNAHEWKDEINIAVYHSEFGKILALFGLSDHKYIPDEIKNLPRHCLELFLSSYIAGDGWRVGNYGYGIGTRSERMRDDLAEVAQKCGYSISTSEEIDWRWKNNPTMYKIYLRYKNSSKRTKVEKKKWFEVEYSGMVFCPSTPNGVIYVRRNGTYYWTGNSELWGAHEEDKNKMWAESTLSPTKYGHSFRWIESYAGFMEESDLLYSLYELGVKIGRAHV